MPKRTRPQGVSPHFLTRQQLADRWMVSTKTVYLEAKRGRIRPTIIGGSVRFAIEEVERYERTS